MLCDEADRTVITRPTRTDGVNDDCLNTLCLMILSTHTSRCSNAMTTSFWHLVDPIVCTHPGFGIRLDREFGIIYCGILIPHLFVHGQNLLVNPSFVSGASGNFVLDAKQRTNVCSHRRAAIMPLNKSRPTIHEYKRLTFFL